MARYRDLTLVGEADLACPPAKDPDEVVVCARRKRNPYRLDGVAAADTAVDAPTERQRLADMGRDTRCAAVSASSGAGCGNGGLNVLAIGAALLGGIKNLTGSGN